MTGARWMHDGYRNFSRIPVGNVGARFDLSCIGETLPDAEKIMLEPIRDQHGFPVCSFDQILQRIQLLVVDVVDVLVFIVDRAVCHLHQLVRQGRGVDGIDFRVVQFGDHIPAHLVVQLLLRYSQRYRL